MGRGFQEGSHVGHAGSGILSLGEDPVAAPSFATRAVRRYFDLGRLVRSVLPLGNGQLMHSVVACGFQGADEDAEKLSSFLMQLCAILRSFVRVSLVLLLVTSTWSPPRSLLVRRDLGWVLG